MSQLWVAQRCGTDVLHVSLAAEVGEPCDYTLCGLEVVRGEWGVYEARKERPNCPDCLNPN